MGRGHSCGVIEEAQESETIGFQQTDRLVLVFDQEPFEHQLDKIARPPFGSTDQRSTDQLINCG
jgi:hypothetical protein